MHIVKMTGAERPCQEHTKKGGFLMGMNHIITFPQQQLNGLKEYQNIQQNFGPGGSNTNMLNHFDLPHPVNLYILKRDILANMVGNQINFVPKGRERFQALIDTDWCTTRFKERLRGNHQYFHVIRVLLNSCQSISKLAKRAGTDRSEEHTSEL